ncbi:MULTISPECIES: hypothetical protein [Lysinibacillus]|uniref:Histidine kinase n=1 Tax=Lysinibacillus antri TaxID=2498145 RepID=A0A432LDW4_9BACI|nr:MULTISPECIES: hypothetical protein [Lysinibacillus]RUL54718.1 hypothetical protein EK386_06015 [Lysinibacillus antri]TSI10999.1 hypothetical protein FJQ64_02145 [Lysinibacillus sp. BW-2-10]
MDKRRLKFVIPVMVIVTVAAIFMLKNYFSDVPKNHQILIVICASLFSGVLAHGLFAQEVEEEPDPKPADLKKK